MKKIIKEGLFWIHFSILFIQISLGFLFSVTTVFLIHIFHASHIYFLKDCVITKYQKKMGMIQKDETFFQHATNRLFHLNLSKKQTNVLYASSVFFTLLVAFLRGKLS